MMRKFLSLTLLLLTATVCAKAQSTAHWTYEYGQSQNDPIVYADLTVNGTTLQANSDYNNYEFAVFANDKLAGVSTLEVAPTDNKAILVFRVETDEESPELTFKVYNNRTQMEFELFTEPVPFTGETIGEPSSPLHLYLNELTSLTLRDIEVNVGDVVDLTQYITTDPEDAAIPNDLTWQIGLENYFTIDGNNLTAINPNTQGITLRVVYGMNMEAPTAIELASIANVYIYYPATQLIHPDIMEVTVNNGDDVTLNNFLSGCCILLPTNTTDVIRWTVKSGTAVAINDNTREPYTNAVGTAVLTGTAGYWKNGDFIERETLAPVEVTVNVVQPVTSITTAFGNNDMPDSWIHCSIGEDLTPYFVDGLAFAIAPANADNKEVRFEHFVLGLDMPAVVISDDGKSIRASNFVTSEPVKVVSVSNPDVYCLVNVIVHNDFTTVTAAQDEYSFFYTGETLNLTEPLADAITLGPNGATSMGGIPSVVSSNPDVVQVSDNGIFGYMVGESTITMTMPVINYLARTFYPDQTTYQTTVSASFKVIISQGLAGISVEWPTDLATAHESTFTVRPLPQGAAFDANARLTVTGVYGDEVGSGFLEDNAYTAYFRPSVPGMNTITVTYDDGEGNEFTATKEMEVGYTFAMSDGWQWRTIPYGYPGQDAGLEAVFGDALVEIRTQSDQLYNDPVYGYFGNELLLSQNVAFKLKMAMNNNDAMREYVFYGGSLGNVGNGIMLRKGWNYLPNPLVLNVPLRSFFAETVVPVEGDRMVSFDSGFAEYANGQWTGDLMYVTAGEGFLFYNAGEAGRTVTFASQVNVEPAPGGRKWV